VQSIVSGLASLDSDDDGGDGDYDKKSSAVSDSATAASDRTNPLASTSTSLKGRVSKFSCICFSCIRVSQLFYFDQAAAGPDYVGGVPVQIRLPRPLHSVFQPRIDAVVSFLHPAYQRIRQGILLFWPDFGCYLNRMFD
jgi:hypothetical protein